MKPENVLKVIICFSAVTALLIPLASCGKSEPEEISTSEPEYQSYPDWSVSLPTVAAESSTEYNHYDGTEPVTVYLYDLTTESTTSNYNQSITSQSTTSSVTNSTASTTSPSTSTPTTASTAFTTEKATSAPASAPATTATQSANTYEYAYAGFNPKIADTSVPFNQLVVNKDYILPANFSVNLGQVTGGAYLDARVVNDYNALVAAAQKDGISLIPVSGYRSVETQKANFERKINLYMGQGMNRTEATKEASNIVLMPRTSEHNAGLAMDFGTNGNYTLDENFENTAAFSWLKEHAADYGFILRYPKDKTAITKIVYEPWHWRYVGKDLAPKINASGLTLEQYFGKA